MKVAVISGKGGSGKSSLTASLIALSPQVVAVDCDVDASNLPLLFPHEIKDEATFASGMEVKVDDERCVGCGICVDNCAFDALEMDSRGVPHAKDFSCEGCGLCVRLCPQQALALQPEMGSKLYTSTFAHGFMVHGELNPGDDNSGQMIARLREMADEQMKISRTELQILDGPPGIGCPVLSTVTGVDRVVIVSEPTLSGISDLKRAYQVASSFCKDIKVVINKCNVNEENTASIHRFCEETQIPVVAQLPFDRRLVEAQLSCQSIVTYAPESVCAQELRSAYAALCQL